MYSFIEQALAVWSAGHSDPPPASPQASSQRFWDQGVIKMTKSILWSSLPGPHDRASLQAICSPHASAWLHALPISACGLRLEDEAVRVSMGFRPIGEPHICPCGFQVDPFGLHCLSCQCGRGRMSHHQQINELIWCSLGHANIPAVKKPLGVRSCSLRRQASGWHVLIPWKGGRSHI